MATTGKWIPNTGARLRLTHAPPPECYATEEPTDVTVRYLAPVCHAESHNVPPKHEETSPVSAFGSNVPAGEVNGHFGRTTERSHKRRENGHDRWKRD